ncbi:ABC transporter substrate-binding protein [uncultured Devosia sp.]|uniref:ABC transporter substrate-binding protein n=1 Tax=uncultured Devosia sp. TaxID=211434 RepID=UPI00341D2D3D
MNIGKSFRTAILASALSAAAMCAPVSAQESEPLTIAYAPVGSFEPFFLAQRMGWFEEAGLTVELVEGSSPDQNIARLLSGEVDIVGTGSTPVVAAIAAGVPIKIIFGNQTLEQVPTTGLITRADAPYQSIGDLAGQTVGVQGLQGTGAFMIKRALRAAGLPTDAVNISHMPPETHIENLKNGNVEAAVPFALFFEQAKNDPELRLIADPYQYVEGMPGIVYASSDAALAERGDDVAALIEVLDRAYAYAAENTDEVRELDKELTRFPEDYLDTRSLPTPGVLIDQGQLEALANDMVEFGFIDQAPTYEQIMWERAPR